MVGLVTGSVTAGLAVGSLALGAYDAYQSSQVAGQQLGIQQSELGMQQSIFNQQQPYRDQLAQLMQNPSSVTKDPGYQFQFDQGSQAVARQMAAGGFLNSGNEAIGLTQYGQGYAQNFYEAQAQLLGNLSGLQVNPASYSSGITGAGSNAIAGQNAAFNQLGTILGAAGRTWGMNNSGGPSSGSGIPDLSGNIANLNMNSAMSSPGAYFGTTPPMWGGGQP